MKKSQTRKSKDANRVPQPPIRKDSLKDLNPDAKGTNVKGGGSVTCYCSRSR
ncbi:MAG: hypothetical protein U0Q55_23210 [Vicinamibacterales bacterium]